MKKNGGANKLETTERGKLSVDPSGTNTPRLVTVLLFKAKLIRLFSFLFSLLTVINSLTEWLYLSGSSVEECKS